MGTQPLAEYLRASQIDNFEVIENMVRIGSRLWEAKPCTCASDHCDGWQMIPLPVAPAANIDGKLSLR